MANLGCVSFKGVRVVSKDDYNCKYCNVKVVLLKSGDICCPECGLLYKIIFDTNKGINRVIALEGEEIKR